MIPIISILVPTFNRKEMLKDTINSVLSQDYPQFEIVISDNASTDGTEELVRSFADPRIKYIKKPENIGGQRNIREGIKELSGAYMMVLPDDDILVSTTFFSKAVDLFNTNPMLSLVYGPVVEYYADEDRSFLISYNTMGINKGIDFLLNYEASPSHPHISALFALLKLDLVKKNDYFQYQGPFFDRWSHLNAMIDGDIGFVSEVIGRFNHHKLNQATHDSETYCQFVHSPKIIDEIFDRAVQQYPEQQNQLQHAREKEYYNTLQWCLAYVSDSSVLSKALSESNLKDTHPKLYKKYKRAILLYKLTYKSSLFVAPFGIKDSVKFLIKAITNKIIVGK